MLEHAIEYAKRNWNVFPVEPRGKRPLVKNWPNAATTDTEQIRKWWAKWPSANIGLACGSRSGVFVVDLDVSDGKQGLESWATLGAEVETLTSQTGSGGKHLFFLYPRGKEIRNKQNVFPGIDIRGESGYVVLPPSVHANGQRYEWSNERESVACPAHILEVIAPTKKVVAPWERQQVAPVPDTRVMDRASAYLREVPAAVQGQAGHGALLWAARCLVEGFELSDADALALLWNEFNPRCQPAWDHGSQKDVRDFERKVAEVHRVPGDKPRGWLLRESGLYGDTDALASMLGADFAELCKRRLQAPAAVPDEGFPLHCFPDKLRKYIELMADVQVVNSSGIALSVLVAAGAAMGNAFRLRLKAGYDVPPTLWGAIISASGTNKSGPFREIIKPLRAEVPFERLQHKMRNPQGQLLIEDTTTEAVLGVLAGSPRGLCLANGEGAGWVGAFDRYSQGGNKKTSVDETIWLKFWDCDTYQKNRKTDSENVLIHSASCGVLVNIQPKKMAECFDPSQFASGLVPRLLVVYLPKQFRGWSEAEMTEPDTLWWKNIIMKLRGQPFASQDPNTGEYFPNIVTLSKTAKKIFIAEFERIAMQIMDADETTTLFLGKQQGLTGRVALVLHGCGAAAGLHEINSELSERTMESAIEIMQYLTNQQLSVYSLAGKTFQEQRTEIIVGVARDTRKPVSARIIMRKSPGTWASSEAAATDLEATAAAGYGKWNSVTKRFTAK